MIYTLFYFQNLIAISSPKICFQLSVVKPKQNYSLHSSQSQNTQTIQWTNQNSKYLPVADATRGRSPDWMKTWLG